MVTSSKQTTFTKLQIVHFHGMEAENRTKSLGHGGAVIIDEYCRICASIHNTDLNNHQQFATFYPFLQTLFFPSVLFLLPFSLSTDVLFARDPSPFPHDNDTIVRLVLSGIGEAISWWSSSRWAVFFSHQVKSSHRRRT